MSNDSESSAYAQAAAQMRSVAAMVAALECDYGRLEELRESVCHYSAGTNMPGYMPDNMPGTFETADGARAYIADDMRRDADDMPEDSEAAAYLRERADALDTLSTECAAAEFGETFETANGSRHYWISYDASPTAGLSDDEKTELAELIEAAGDCESEDDARERITEDALSVEVRSGWHTVGEAPEPEEFRIVLCTGGPHVEIRGRLNDHNEPERCELHYAGWGVRGEYRGDALDTDALETYARQFYFGD